MIALLARTLFLVLLPLLLPDVAEFGRNGRFSQGRNLAIGDVGTWIRETRSRMEIEAGLPRKVHQHYPPEHDALLFDATDLFALIATSNQRCAIAQRGKLRQKRHDP